MNNKKDNSGFTLLELMIVVTVISVLLGIFVPSYISYVNKAKRTIDADTALKIRDAITRVQAVDNMGTHGGGFKYTVACAWNCDSKMPTEATNFLEAIFLEIGKVPVSKTNKKLFWVVYYNVELGEVQHIYLSDFPGSSKKCEIYPDATQWIQKGGL
ncbi:MAG: prepilin-type N-terminal cleavage/methylation domain-containing protein [Lachnospiraceae bacterium]|nr:prepilin-type N-terminal cleavage/methylation domain-containing protein [Lachnospiraceae bacterium]MBQ5851812.1 prepilin-type N-terminal cleavage/methylation domain-containing protein [Lachnospiraceae bacterium]MEE0918608.1 prepilin-type N-terminal cleavage/methylation domain-containing protein [Lachnospiraceae bacterium]